MCLEHHVAKINKDLMQAGGGFLWQTLFCVYHLGKYFMPLRFCTQNAFLLIINGISCSGTNAGVPELACTSGISFA